MTESDETQRKAALFEAALAEREKTQPLARPQAAGGAILDHLLLASKQRGGAHLPSLAAALGSLGGHACQVAALAGLAAQDPEYGERTVVTVDVTNGERFLMGDAITWPLLERPYSFWGLVGGAAHHLGATPPDALELVRHSAETLGGPDFGIPRGALGADTGSTPREWLRVWHGMHRVTSAIAPDPQHGPIAVGIAVQQLFDLANTKAPGRYDLGEFAGLVLDCALTTSKILATEQELGSA